RVPWWSGGGAPCHPSLHYQRPVRGIHGNAYAHRHPGTWGCLGRAVVRHVAVAADRAKPWHDAVVWNSPGGEHPDISVSAPERWCNGSLDCRRVEEHSRVDIFLQFRTLLVSIAYRMLGSMADAEDLVQETFIRWQTSTEAHVRSPRAYLVTILSRLCIQQLESARVH